MRKPRSWAYSTKAWLKLGSRLSASTTMLDMLSGMTTLKTPPKKAQAASKPETTTSVVWRKLRQHIAVPRVTSREDERPAHPLSACSRVGQKAHPPEVDLQLHSGLAVSDTHCRAPVRTADA